MKKLYFLSLIFFIVACTNNKEINSNFLETKASELCITDNPDYQRYLSISKEVLGKVAESDLTEAEILNFLEASDYDTIFNEINANTTDIERYDSIAIYAQRIAAYYSTDTGDCSLCVLTLKRS